MPISILITTPDDKVVTQEIDSLNVTSDKLEVILQEIGRIAEENMLNYLQEHVVTGETMSSIRTKTINKTTDDVTVAVGSDTRGFQLRILDRGRRDVYPVRARMLRWIQHPEGVIIFALHSRAVAPSNIMRQSGDLAIGQAKSIIDKSLNVSYTT